MPGWDGYPIRAALRGALPSAGLGRQRRQRDGARRVALRDRARPRQRGLREDRHGHRRRADLRRAAAPRRAGQPPATSATSRSSTTRASPVGAATSAASRRSPAAPRSRAAGEAAAREGRSALLRSRAGPGTARSRREDVGGPRPRRSRGRRAPPARRVDVGAMLASVVNFFNPSLIVHRRRRRVRGDVLLASIREIGLPPLAAAGDAGPRHQALARSGVIGAATMAASCSPRWLVDAARSRREVASAGWRSSPATTAVPGRARRSWRDDAWPSPVAARLPTRSADRPGHRRRRRAAASTLPRASPRASSACRSSTTSTSTSRPGEVHADPGRERRRQVHADEDPRRRPSARRRDDRARRRRRSASATRARRRSAASASSTRSSTSSRSGRSPQNIFLGREPRRGLARRRPRRWSATTRRAARRSSARATISPGTLGPDALRSRSSRRSRSPRRSRSTPRVLVMDEPTAALSPHEVDALFERVRLLQRARPGGALHLAPAEGDLRPRRSGSPCSRTAARSAPCDVASRPRGSWCG